MLLALISRCVRQMRPNEFLCHYHLAFICKYAWIISPHEILFLNQATENRNPAKERKLSPEVRQRYFQFHISFFFLPLTQEFLWVILEKLGEHISYGLQVFFLFNLVILFFGQSSWMTKGSWSSTGTPLLAVGPGAIQRAREVIRNVLTL